MYISHVRLKDIRGFAGTRTVDLSLRRPSGEHAGWTVLAGRNGAGKTSLLRALALAVSGPAVARNLVADYEYWVTVGASEGRAIVSVAPSADWDLWPREGSMSISETIQMGINWRTVDTAPGGRRRGGGVQPTLEIDQFTDSVAYLGPWYENPIGWFCAGYGPFRRLTRSPGGGGRLMHASRNVDRLAGLFSEEATLTEGVSWLITQHLRALEGQPYAAELKETALRILADGLLPDDFPVEGVNSDGLWTAKGGKPFPIREMSDGYQTVTALVVDLLKHIFEAFDGVPNDLINNGVVVNAPGIVLIDEVENHLHISWQKRIGSWLKQHFPRIQFIVTTHSPYICQDADPGGLIRLSGPNEEVRPHIVDEDLYERIVYGSGDDAAVSELFGVETPYSQKAEVLRRELVNLEMAVIQGAASVEQLRRYQELRERLTSSTVARTDEVSARLGRRPQA